LTPSRKQDAQVEASHAWHETASCSGRTLALARFAAASFSMIGLARGQEPIGPMGIHVIGGSRSQLGRRFSRPGIDELVNVSPLAHPLQTMHRIISLQHTSEQPLSSLLSIKVIQKRLDAQHQDIKHRVRCILREMQKVRSNPQQGSLSRTTLFSSPPTTCNASGSSTHPRALAQTSLLRFWMPSIVSPAANNRSTSHAGGGVSFHWERFVVI
jgi:hypothetical protein